MMLQLYTLEYDTTCQKQIFENKLQRTNNSQDMTGKLTLITPYSFKLKLHFTSKINLQQETLRYTSSFYSAWLNQMKKLFISPKQHNMVTHTSLSHMRCKRRHVKTLIRYNATDAIFEIVQIAMLIYCTVFTSGLAICTVCKYYLN